MTTRNKYPKYVMDSIKSTLIMKMVNGDFGFIPRPGASGPRVGDGFYVQAQTWVEKTYGKPTGQGIVHGCGKQALKIQKVVNPSSVTSHVRRAKVVTESLMLRRLSQKNCRAVQTSSERGFIASLKAYRKETPLSTSQQKKVKSLYLDIYVIRYKQNSQ